MHNFFLYIYFYSLHVSGSHVSNIRRTNCINATPGICHYMQMTVWYAGQNEKKNTSFKSVVLDSHV